MIFKGLEYHMKLLLLLLTMSAILCVTLVIEEKYVFKIESPSHNVK